VNARGLTLLLAVLSVGLCLVSTGIGSASLDLGQALRDAVAGHATLPALVLVELRIPRAVIGYLVGFSLGLSGAALQGLLRNPLAEPGIVGVSSAAALGAVIVFYSGLAGSGSLALPAGGIVGAAAATLVLFLMAGAGAGTTTLILAGVAINTFAGAATALALNLAPNPYAVLEIVFWLMGSLADRSLLQIWLVLPLMLLGWALLLSTGHALDALSIGEDSATSLGFRLSRLRATVIVGAALCVGGGVSVTGAIGFVGLVVPHLLRRFYGASPGRLLLPSAFGGAALILAADIGIRVIGVRPELKLGVVTAMIGAPFLFHLIWRQRRVG
jgi:iron complex transport system permease protein